MSRIPWSNWGWVPLAALVFGCGRTTRDEALDVASPGSGGSVATNGTSAVGGTTLGTGASGGAAGAAGVPGAGEASSWQQSVLLETDDAGSARDPRIAMNDDGAAIVAWVQFDGMHDDIWATLYTPDAGWSGAERIGEEGFNVSEPHVAIDDEGSAMVLWSASEGSAEVWSTRYVVGSGWQETELVNEDRSETAQAPDFGLDAQGNAVAVWREYSGGDDHLWSKRYTPEAGWGSSVRFQSAATAPQPRLALNRSGNTIVVWTQGSDDLPETIWSSHAAADLAWTAPEGIQSVVTEQGSSPEVAIDPQGNAMAIWHQFTDAEVRVWVKRFVAGVGWDNAEVITTAPKGTSTVARVGMDGNGNAIAVWQHANGVSDDAIWANRYSIESGWGDTQPLSADAPSAHSLGVAVGTAGDAVVVWTQQPYGEVRQLWSNRYTPGRGWGQAELVDFANGDLSHGVEIGIDGEGNAIAVRAHGEGDLASIWANHSSRPE